MNVHETPDLSRIDALGDLFEAAWRRGERPRLEGFLVGSPQGVAREVLFQHLWGIEIELRRKAGESPEAGEYAARFPEHRDLIENVLPQAIVPGTTTFPDPFPDEFQVLAFLGKGGFGEVWLAREIALDRLVALKTIRRHHTRSAERALAALRNDATRLAQLRHRNLVRVHSWRQRDDQCFLILEYVPGGSFAERLKWAGPLDWHRAARYVADVADALTLVHRHGLVHRDIKPGNVLWDPDDDEARLTDFGLAVLLAEATGFAGTLPYMAPEAMRGQVGPEADVYSLALTLFEMIVGERPFPGPEAADFLSQKMKGLDKASPYFSGWPVDLRRLVLEGLEPDPERRLKLAELHHRIRALVNQALADDLLPATNSTLKAPLTVELQRERGPSDFEPLPIDPDHVSTVPLRTGDRLQLDVRVGDGGHLTVFNIGPTGNLNRLAPEDPDAAPIAVNAGAHLAITDIELTPPAGPERLCVLWTRVPVRLGGTDLRHAAGLPSYVATRDLKRVRRDIQALPPEDWSCVVVGLTNENDRTTAIDQDQVSSR